MNKDVLYVGMDLGSFKTAVVASNGRRENLLTAVGWPRDHVARAMLGRDVVFGEDLIRQRLAIDVVRPFAKGALKYLSHDKAGFPDASLARHKEAARLLVREAVSRLEPPEGAPVYGVIGAFVSSDDREQAGDHGCGPGSVLRRGDRRGTLQRGLRDELPERCPVVDIAGTIDICPITKRASQGGRPGGRSSAGATPSTRILHRRVKQLYPGAQLSLNMARGIKEKYGFVHDLDESAIVNLPVAGRPREFDVTEPLKQACVSIVGQIVAGLCEVVGRFDPEFQRRLLGNIILGGGGSQIKGLDRLIEAALEPYGGGNVTRVYDSVFAGATGALKLAMSMPVANWEKLESLDSRTKETAHKAA